MNQDSIKINTSGLCTCVSISCGVHIINNGWECKRSQYNNYDFGLNISIDCIYKYKNTNNKNNAWKTVLLHMQTILLLISKYNLYIYCSCNKEIDKSVYINFISSTNKKQMSKLRHTQRKVTNFERLFLIENK